MSCKSLRSMAFVILITLGFLQIIVGYHIGPLLIYGVEAPFWHELGAPQGFVDTFMKYIGILKSQWMIVFWFGITNMIFSCLLYLSSQSK